MCKLKVYTISRTRFESICCSDFSFLLMIKAKWIKLLNGNVDPHIYICNYKTVKYKKKYVIILLKNKISFICSWMRLTLHDYWLKITFLINVQRCCTTSSVPLRQQGVTVEEDGMVRDEEKKKLPAWRSRSTPSSRPRFSAPTRSRCYTKSDFWVKVSPDTI